MSLPEVRPLPRPPVPAAPRPGPRRRRRRDWMGAVVVATWILGLVPLAGLVLSFLAGGLGANPVQALTHDTGRWALRLLLASLAVTPLRRLTGAGRLMRLRRPLGLLAFVYGTAHLSIFFVFDHALDPVGIAADVSRRPWVTVGMATWVVLLTLAVTSTRGWMRRLGKRWQRLHRAVYLAGAGAILHWLWLVKADHQEPLVYGGVLALLLGARVGHVLRRRLARPPVRRPPGHSRAPRPRGPPVGRAQV